ncbi:AMP-binding enzyme family protein [Mycobacterium xenopi 4042]|uniref:AMP-binding enzyme family protein n=1 Tax=Mycobacterium xenopi 4042 TaxID=1299334 RepID=X8E2U9_MYCXE|nr:AMP-binding enzyme family protein [Mycobacterium xenopi 4042]
MLDGNGNLTWLDRLKDSLRRRGENISSVEVEGIVMRHPAVVEAAVVGVPSELGEDDILLFVTVRPRSHWITPSCSTSALSGCRTSVYRDMSRS